MRVIVAGSRTITKLDDVVEAITFSKFKIKELVSGGCLGPDRLAERWARRGNIPIRQFLPDWWTLGKGAGPIRNEEMAQYADALIAVWDGKSTGTRDMITRARRHGLKVYVHKYYEQLSLF